MQTSSKEIVNLEKQFWQSMVDNDTATALELLDEPALMVSSHGAMKFDHAGYRKMAEQGTMTVKSFELSDIEAVFPNDNTAVLNYKVQQTLQMRGKPQTIDQEMVDSSVWVRKGGKWLCVMHTETPVEKSKPN